MHLIAGGQWFSRWHYEAHDPTSPDAWAQTEDAGLDAVPGYRRINNITDWCLQQFRTQYPALHISKDDIWHYLYGVLHAPDYRKRYKADLSKDLPRIPFAPTSARSVTRVLSYRPSIWAMRPVLSTGCQWT